MKTLLIICLLTLSTSYTFGQVTREQLHAFLINYTISYFDGTFIKESTEVKGTLSYLIEIPYEFRFSDVKASVNYLLNNYKYFTIDYDWTLGDTKDVFLFKGFRYSEIPFALGYWPEDKRIVIIFFTN